MAVFRLYNNIQKLIIFLKCNFALCRSKMYTKKEQKTSKRDVLSQEGYKRTLYFVLPQEILIFYGLNFSFLYYIKTQFSTISWLLNFMYSDLSNFIYYFFKAVTLNLIYFLEHSYGRLLIKIKYQKQKKFILINKRYYKKMKCNTIYG